MKEIPEAYIPLIAYLEKYKELLECYTLGINEKSFWTKIDQLSKQDLISIVQGALIIRLHSDMWKCGQISESMPNKEICTAILLNTNIDNALAEMKSRKISATLDQDSV